MIFGWDISTSIIGFSVFTNTCQYITSEYIDLTDIDKDLIEKSYSAEMWISRLIDKYCRQNNEKHYHFIEDRLGGFAMGGTMQQTLMKLAAFNATVTYIIWHSFHLTGLSVHVEHLHPATVKAIMKKEGLVIPKGPVKIDGVTLKGSKLKKVLTLDYVKNKEKKFPFETNKNNNAHSWCYDMADSYCIARAGFIKRIEFFQNAQGTKNLHSEDGPETGREESRT